MGTKNRGGDSAETVESAQGWARNFAAAPLTPSDAADLVAGALKASKAAGQAALRLTWLTQDTFADTMRRMEQADGY